MDRNTLADLMEIAGRNMAHNLDFIPAGKWTWKPAPTANSASEILTHIIGNFRRSEGGLSDADNSALADPKQAKALLIELVEKAASDYRTATPEQLAQTFEMPGAGMTISVEQLGRISAVDLLHHHGQIAYIQSLLGDDESHFDPMAAGPLFS